MSTYLVKFLNFGYTLSNDVLKLIYKVLQIMLDFCLRGVNKLLWLLYKNFFNLFIKDNGKLLPKIKTDYRYNHKTVELDKLYLILSDLQLKLSDSVSELHNKDVELQKFSDEKKGCLNKIVELTYERDELLGFKNGILGQYVINKLLAIKDYWEDDISKLEFDRLSMIFQGVTDFSRFNNFDIILDYYSQDCFSKYVGLYDKYMHSSNFTSIGSSDVILDLKHSYVLMSGYVFLPESVQDRISSDVFFDFGGFDGMGALMFSQVSRKVFVFEPAKHFEILKKNIEYSGVNSIEYVNSGVSCESGVIKFADYEDEVVVSSRLLTSFNDHVGVKPTKLYDVTITTIDEFVSQNLLKDDKLGLMKFDIEGAEYDAIQGGLKTIKKHKPVMLISIYHNGRDMLEIINVIKNLNLGYKFMLRHLSPYIFHEWILICYVTD